MPNRPSRTVIRAGLPIVGLAALVIVLSLAPPTTEVPPEVPGDDPPARDLDPDLLTGPDPGFDLPHVPPPDPADEGRVVVVSGSGWGHSVGMSQYGAQAQALAGRSHRDIIGHYYPGTTIEPHGAAAGSIRVGLFRNRPVQDAQRVELRSAGRGGQPPTRPVEVTIGGQTLAVPHGETWAVEVRDGELAVVDADGGVRARAAGPARAVFGFLDGVPTLLALPQLARSGAPLAGLFQWGHLEVSLGEDGQAQPVLVLPLELYLRGLAEMPASWHPQALAAQALAGRTFAVRQVLEGVDDDCACHLGATPHDQVYAGWEKEAGPGGDAWRAAVEATAGQVVTHDGALAWTYYSSSHGGRTEASEDSWAYDEAHPYLRSVDDPWSLEAGVGNPMRTWERRFDAREFAYAVGLVRLDAVEIAERTDGGTPAVLSVSGRDVAGRQVAYEFRGWRTGVAGSDLKLAFGSELPSQQLRDIRVVDTDGTEPVPGLASGS